MSALKKSAAHICFMALSRLCRQAMHAPENPCHHHRQGALRADVRCCRFAKQARLFKEMEDEAFPDFLTGPPGDACGDMAATQWADAGEQPERRLDRQDKPVAEEGSSVSTSDCTSSSSASMPEATRQSAAGNISDAPPIRAPSKMPKVPFHRVPYCVRACRVGT